MDKKLSDMTKEQLIDYMEEKLDKAGSDLNGARTELDDCGSALNELRFMESDNILAEWYDLDANPCDGWRYNEIIGSKERFLACTHVGKLKVSTIWLGRPHAGEGTLNIFETMVFDGKYDFVGKIDPVRYDTKEQALKGHEIIVNKLKINKDK